MPPVGKMPSRRTRPDRRNGPDRRTEPGPEAVAEPGPPTRDSTRQIALRYRMPAREPSHLRTFPPWRLPARPSLRAGLALHCAPGSPGTEPDTADHRNICTDITTSNPDTHQMHRGCTCEFRACSDRLTAGGISPTRRIRAEAGTRETAYLQVIDIYSAAGRYAELGSRGLTPAGATG